MVSILTEFIHHYRNNSNQCLFFNFDIVYKYLGRLPALSPVVEQELADHILFLDKYFFGLTIREVRSLAFDILEKNPKIENPFNKTTRMAGKKWYYSFMARNPQLRLRQPECISMSRVKGFNKENVNEFFDLLESVVDEHKFDGTRIYNMDESGFSTVQKKAQKVISEKGKHQVGAISSGERGVNTTFVCCCNAAGSFVPPMIIFKRLRNHDSLANDKPTGSIVTVSESGYINSELFVLWLKHFIEFVHPSPSKKVLLLLDGHTTHSKNLTAINLARDNGIIMLQLPGHTTHRLQPLDVSIFKPMETYYEEAIQQWLRSNPGRRVTQFEVSKILGIAYARAASIQNAESGFKATGVWKVNRRVFNDSDFAPSENLNTSNSNDPMMNNPPTEDDSEHEDDPGLISNTVTLPPSSNLRSSISTDIILTPTTSKTPSPRSSLEIPIKEISPLPTPNSNLVKRYEKGAQKAVVLTTSPYKNALVEKENKKLQAVADKQARKEARETKKKSCA